MGIFLDKVADETIKNSTQLNNSFLIVINKFKKNYYKSNDILLVEILDDYYIAVEKLKLKTIFIDREFNIFIFSQLMAKIKSIGILKSSLDKNNFTKYRELLIKEVRLDDEVVSSSIEYILDNMNVIETSKESLVLLNKFWANYLEILVNLHQYTKTNIKTNMRIAESFLNDFIKENNYKETVDALFNINKWLQKVVSFCTKDEYIERI